MEAIVDYKYILIPAIVWLGVQLFKVIYLHYETKKWDWTRLFGNGGMPSAHSAVVTCLATMIGKYEGITTAEFAISFFVAFVVMNDAAGLRKNVGRQAKVLNAILTNNNKTGAKKLQEMTGHTPIQVLVGAAIGILIGILV